LLTHTLNTSTLPTLFPRPTRSPSRSPLFPYTTLFRSSLSARRPGDPADGGAARAPLSRYSFSAREPLGVAPHAPQHRGAPVLKRDRKSTRLNSSHVSISYAVFCLKKKKETIK